MNNRAVWIETLPIGEGTIKYINYKGNCDRLVFNKALEGTKEVGWIIHTRVSLDQAVLVCFNHTILFSLTLLSRTIHISRILLLFIIKCVSINSKCQQREKYYMTFVCWWFSLVARNMFCLTSLLILLRLVFKPEGQRRFV